MRHQKTRLTAVLTLGFYLWAQLAGDPLLWAAPAALSAPGISLPSVQYIEIPESAGRVDFFAPARPASGETSKPVLFHLQEPHGDLTAQKNILSLLRFLKNQYGVDTVLLEGSPFQLHPEQARFQNVSRESAVTIQDELAKQGWLGGPELFLVRERNVRGIGIENLKAYKENLQTFYRVMSRRKESAQWEKAAGAAVNDLMNRGLHSGLLEFLKHQAMQEDGVLPFERWMDILKDRAVRVLHVDLTDPAWQLDWPMLVRFFKIQPLQNRLDADAYEKEKPLFLNALKRLRRPLSPGTQKFFETFLSASAPDLRMNPEEAGPMLEELVRALPQDFAYGQYPQTMTRLALWILHNELSAQDFMREVETLAGRIEQALIKTEKEKQITQIYREYRLYRKLLVLGLNRKEAETLDGLPELSLFEQNLRKLAGNVRESGNPMPELFQEARRFYAQAQIRDRWMTQRIESVLKETGKNKAAVITGGFHAPAFQDYFTRRGFSYVLISPKSEAAPSSQARYADSVLRQVQPAASSEIRLSPVPLMRTRELRRLGISGGPYRRALRQIKRGLQAEPARSEIRHDVKIEQDARQRLLSAEAHLRKSLDHYAGLLSRSDRMDPQELNAIVLLGNPDAHTFRDFARLWHAWKAKGISIPLVLAGGRGRGTVPLAQNLMELYSASANEVGFLAVAAQPDSTITETQLIRWVFRQEGADVTYEGPLTGRDAEWFYVEKEPSRKTAENFLHTRPILEELFPGKEHLVIALVTRPDLLARAQPTAMNLWPESWKVKKFALYPNQDWDALPLNDVIELAGYMAGYPRMWIKRFASELTLSGNPELKGIQDQIRNWPEQKQASIGLTPRRIQLLEEALAAVRNDFDDLAEALGQHAQIYPVRASVVVRRSEVRGSAPDPENLSRRALLMAVAALIVCGLFAAGLPRWPLSPSREKIIKRVEAAYARGLKEGASLPDHMKNGEAHHERIQWEGRTLELIYGIYGSFQAAEMIRKTAREVAQNPGDWAAMVETGRSQSNFADNAITQALIQSARLPYQDVVPDAWDPDVTSRVVQTLGVSEETFKKTRLFRNFLERVHLAFQAHRDPDAVIRQLFQEWQSAGVSKEEAVSLLDGVEVLLSDAAHRLFFVDEVNRVQTETIRQINLAAAENARQFLKHHPDRKKVFVSVGLNHAAAFNPQAPNNLQTLDVSHAEFFLQAWRTAKQDAFFQPSGIPRSEVRAQRRNSAVVIPQTWIPMLWFLAVGLALLFGVIAGGYHPRSAPAESPSVQSMPSHPDTLLQSGPWEARGSRDTGPGAGVILTQGDRSFSEGIVFHNRFHLFSVKGNGYLRIKVPGAQWGTSFVTFGYWTFAPDKDGKLKEKYVHNAAIRNAQVKVNARGNMELHGIMEDDLGNFRADDFKIEFEPLTVMGPSRNVQMHVSFTLTAEQDVRLVPGKIRTREAFKIIQLSSNHVSAGHDADTAVYRDSQGRLHEANLGGIQEGFFFSDPGSLGRPARVWLENKQADILAKPATFIELGPGMNASDFKFQGWKTSAFDLNDDNIGAWLHDASVPEVIRKGTQRKYTFTLGGYYRRRSEVRRESSEKGRVKSEKSGLGFSSTLNSSPLILHSISRSETVHALLKRSEVRTPVFQTVDRSRAPDLETVRGKITLKPDPAFLDPEKSFAWYLGDIALYLKNTGRELQSGQTGLTRGREQFLKRERTIFIQRRRDIKTLWPHASPEWRLEFARRYASGNVAMAIIMAMDAANSTIMPPDEVKVALQRIGTVAREYEDRVQSWIAEGRRIFLPPAVASDDSRIRKRGRIKTVSNAQTSEAVPALSAAPKPVLSDMPAERQDINQSAPEMAKNILIRWLGINEKGESVGGGIFHDMPGLRFFLPSSQEGRTFSVEVYARQDLSHFDEAPYLSVTFVYEEERWQKVVLSTPKGIPEGHVFAQSLGTIRTRLYQKAELWTLPYEEKHSEVRMPDRPSIQLPDINSLRSDRAQQTLLRWFGLTELGGKIPTGILQDMPALAAYFGSASGWGFEVVIHAKQDEHRLHEAPYLTVRFVMAEDRWKEALLEAPRGLPEGHPLRLHLEAIRVKLREKAAQRNLPFRDEVHFEKPVEAFRGRSELRMEIPGVLFQIRSQVLPIRWLEVFAVKELAAVLSRLLGRRAYAEKVGILPIEKRAILSDADADRIQKHTAQISDAGRVALDQSVIESLLEQNPQELWVIFEWLAEISDGLGPRAAVVGDKELLQKITRKLLNKNTAGHERVQAFLAQHPLESLVNMVPASQLGHYIKAHDYGVTVLSEQDLRAFVPTEALFQMDTRSVHPKDLAGLSALLPRLLKLASLIRSEEQGSVRLEMLQRQLDQIPGAQFKNQRFEISLEAFVQSLVQAEQLTGQSA